MKFLSRIGQHPPEKKQIVTKKTIGDIFPIHFYEEMFVHKKNRPFCVTVVESKGNEPS